MTIRNKIILLTIGFVGFVFLPIGAFAAELSIEPSEGRYFVGDTFIASIFVNAEAEAINAVEATLNFPGDLLEVVDLNTYNSILQLWIDDPAYINELGLITFIGGVPAEGYTEKKGFIGKIIFRVKKEGQAFVSFKDDSSRILLADGLGTETLLTTTPTFYEFVSKKKLLYYFLITFLIIFLVGIIIWKIWKSKKRNQLPAHG